MKRIISYLIYGLLLILQVSCFEIIEEVNLNTDGSGNFKYTVNFSRSKTYIKALLSDAENSYDIPSENIIKNEINKSLSVCKSTNGITNVTSDLDFENYICVFSCNFVSIKQLNQMILNVRIQRKDKTENMKPFYTYSPTSFQFKRLNDKVFSDIYNNLEQNKRKILTDADYTCIYRFKPQILNYSNSNALLSKNKSSILLRTKILEIIHQSKTLKNTIKLNL